ATVHALVAEKTHLLAGDVVALHQRQTGETERMILRQLMGGRQDRTVVDIVLGGVIGECVLVHQQVGTTDLVGITLDLLIVPRVLVVDGSQIIEAVPSDLMEVAHGCGQADVGRQRLAAQLALAVPAPAAVLPSPRRLATLPPTPAPSPPPPAASPPSPAPPPPPPRAPP